MVAFSGADLRVFLRSGFLNVFSLLSYSIFFLMNKSQMSLADIFYKGSFWTYFFLLNTTLPLPQTGILKNWQTYIYIYIKRSIASSLHSFENHCPSRPFHSIPLSYRASPPLPPAQDRLVDSLGLSRVSRAWHRDRSGGAKSKCDKKQSL